MLATLLWMLALRPAGPAPLPDDGLRIQPGTLICLDSLAPNTHAGPYRLVQYDLSGNILDLLVLVDTVAFGIPSGVTVMGGDVFLCSPSREVAQVDLATGEILQPFHITGSGIEAMTDLDGQLYIASYGGAITVRDREGFPVRDIQLEYPAGATGIDTDGNLLYVGSHADGDVHVFDLDGDFQHEIATGIGPESLSGLSFDRRSQTLWITTGFGSDELRQYDLDGNLLFSIPVGIPFLNGVDAIDESLILDAEPNFCIGGDTLRFEIFDGSPGSPFAHFVSSIDGAPFFHRLRSGLVPASGRDEWDVLVPPGLAPLVIGHTAFAFDGSGAVVASNEEFVHHH